MRAEVRNPLRIISSVLLAIPVMLVGAGSASAVLPSHVPDYRGDPNSVHVMFERDTSWNREAFDTVASIYPLDPTQPWASDDGADTIIDLPNFIDSLPLKLMRIQMWFGGSVPHEPLSISIHDVSGSQLLDYQIVDRSGPGDSVFHWFDVEIRPNPDSEQITIQDANSPGQLMKFEIDTISIVPEPATLGLLLIGGLVVQMRRRR